jgi:hypothetical protein
MADGDLGGAGDNPNAPIFPGRPGPRTARELFDECEEALRLIGTREIEDRASAALFRRWQEAMRAISDVEPEPYPDWLRRQLPAYLQQSSMWTPVSSMNLELLADSIERVKVWCDARTLEEKAEALEPRDAATRDQKTGPDGLIPPNKLRIGGRVIEMEPIPWRLLRFIWDAMPVEIEDACQEVWGGRPGEIADNALKVALAKVNKALSDVNASWRLSSKNGYLDRKQT